jgi:hypothetical protein
VGDFNTGNGARDRKMREVMAADVHPQVRLTVHAADAACLPVLGLPEAHCRGTLDAELTIRDVTKRLSIPYLISEEEKQFNISGEFPLVWSEFHVEDPSILIAKLNPNVQVAFSVHLPAGKEPPKR